jgi:hypothetical protein
LINGCAGVPKVDVLNETKAAVAENSNIQKVRNKSIKCGDGWAK